MKASLFFLLYFLLAAALAASITYPLYELIHTGSFRFERWVTRAGLLFLVLGMIPIFKFSNLSFKNIGHIDSVKPAIRKVTHSFLIGLVILSVVIFAIIALDIRRLDPTIDLTLYVLTKALVAGILVSLIEETLFRGVFFTLAKKWHSALAAVFISSFFYTSFHFIKPIAHIEEQSLSWLSGFEVMFNAFHALLSIDATDYIALFSVGLLLGLVRLRTNNLAYTIGLHASWVFLIKVFKDITHSTYKPDWAFLTGELDGVIGLLSSSWLILLSFIYFIYIVKKPIPSPI